MTERPFTTPEYPSTTDRPIGESTLDTSTTSSYAEAQVAASPYESSSSVGSSQGSATDTAREAASTAKDEARSVASDAKESTKHVAETAKSEAKDVAAQTQQQARELLHQLRGEMTDQASGQAQRAAGGLRALADELGQMVGGTQQQGLATDVARQASDRARSFADWIEHREPGDILNEARDFARRKPGTFLAAAAAIGFLGGRLTRGLADDDGATTSAPQSFSSATPTYGGEPYAAEAAERYAETSPMASDPDRVGAGIDPATYSHPDPTHRPVDSGHGFPSGGQGREIR